MANRNGQPHLQPQPHAAPSTHQVSTYRPVQRTQEQSQQLIRDCVSGAAADTASRAFRPAL